jgi:hypothetical protein
MSYPAVISLVEQLVPLTPPEESPTPEPPPEHAKTEEEPEAASNLKQEANEQGEI